MSHLRKRYLAEEENVIRSRSQGSYEDALEHIRKADDFLAIFIRLVPFTLATITYFVELVPREQSAAAAFIKCLPIICLIVFVGLHSMNMDEIGQWYARVIIIGLIFCGLGDALLIWPSLFELGVLAFAIGHVCYIIAFGFQPRAWIIAVLAYAFATGVLIYLGPSLRGIELGGVPVYAYIILTMVWRACARLTERQNWSWSKLITAVGAVMFATSDILLALNRYKLNMQYGGILVMSTYYGAQLLIALSVIEPRPPTKEISIGSRKMWCV